MDRDLYPRWVRNLGDYKQIRLIGSGRFGDVYLAEDNTTHEQVALRLVTEAPGVTSYVFRTVEMAEIKPHPAMCEFRGYNPSPALVVMQYMPNGSLASLLEPIWEKQEVPKQWNGTLRAKILFGVAAAMQHLHAHDRLHRYLTPSNILFDRNWEPRVSDFGFARVKCDIGKLSNIQCTVDTYMYTSPEALSGTQYSEKTDVFSYGMIIYAVITGLRPFVTGVSKGQLSQQTALVEGKRPQIPEETDERLVNLINACWEQQEDLRPTFAQILRMLNAEMLFEDVDMDDYSDYCQRVLRATTMRPIDSEQFSEPRAEDVENFERTRRLAQSGDINAILSLGMLYRKGIGTVQNHEKSFECFKQAAERGSAAGMYNTAVGYIKGEGCKEDMRSAMVWLKRAVERRLPDAECCYAICLVDGRAGVDKDEDEGLRILRRLSESPYERPDHMCEYAFRLEARGKFAEAKRWYQKSSDLGCDDAVCHLARMHLEGTGCPQNIPEGIRLYKMAAERSFPRSSYNLGMIYKRGLYGQEKDVEQAEKYLNRARLCGLVQAISSLAGMYLEMADEAKRSNRLADQRVLEEKAFSILERGIHQDGNCMHCVGRMKYRGKGTPLDVDNGLKLLREAVTKHRWYESAVFLGDLFAKGDDEKGVPKNLELSRQYYEKAKLIAKFRKCFE